MRTKAARTFMSLIVLTCTCTVRRDLVWVRGTKDSQWWKSVAVWIHAVLLVRFYVRIVLDVGMRYGICTCTWRYSHLRVRVWVTERVVCRSENTYAITSVRCPMFVQFRHASTTYSLSHGYGSVELRGQLMSTFVGHCSLWTH